MNDSVERLTSHRVISIRIGQSVHKGNLVQASLCAISDLSEVERRKWDVEMQYRRFRLNWLSGRIAAKQAVQSILTELSIQPMLPGEITIENDENGIPFVSSLQTRCTITIAHSDTWGLAFAIPYIRGIGCDLESIKPRRSEEFKYFLSSSEITLWNRLVNKISVDIALTAAWAAKEAAIKCVCSHIGRSDFEHSDLMVFPDAIREGDFRFELGHLSGIGRWIEIDDLKAIVALSTI